MNGDRIDRDFGDVDTKTMREPAALLDEITEQALEALERGQETTAPLLAILIEVGRLRMRLAEQAVPRREDWPSDVVHVAVCARRMRRLAEREARS
ncbi:hypothetical protein FVP74_09345 [Microbacterium saccharophilum]|uniref:Uncharacterized protein n=1 Tax=Microbacterium saccharophilum TaxID=1213358 RepID=A0A5C8I1E1_9MICO|nr:hypothetical protein [Microbacterium saccharophilum]TXK11523.1 hypothetical protein FVP74_09345 [Microbacterium saccharophilum]GEP49077.1 hypothetical protein MSA03_25850 [Microbacterium saccharophilum]